jgi:acyl-CoA thioesterase
MSEFTGNLGMETGLMADGTCEMQLVVDERHLSTAERVHGGVFFTMLDTAMGRAVISVLPEGQGCATVEAKINYFRPVQRGRLLARATVVSKTRRTAYAEASLIDEEDRLVARASGTFFLTESLRQGDRERV